MNRTLRTLVKSAFLGVLFLNAQLLYAGTMGESASLLARSGVYVGGDIGLSNIIDAESHLIVPESHQLSSTGLVGGGLLGYDYSLSTTVVLGV
ncbi:MAG: hypothetical protein EBX41_11045 [Chitinophagia bacterium]|nr:hypothetical protein [Chitinophagia bacterium]